MQYKKFLFLACLVFGIIILTSCSSVAKNKFIEVNIDKNIASGPVALDNNRIFYAGGVRNKDTGKYSTAKIYDFDNNSMYDTGAVMNIPRSGYGTIKLNDSNLLILGGFCQDPQKKKYDCNKTAEIYDLKENKFYKIDDSKLEYRVTIQYNKLDNGNIIVTSGKRIEIFDSNKFKFIEQIIPLNDFFISNVFELNPKELLIYGETRLSSNLAMEIYNIETKKSSNIVLPKDVIKSFNMEQAIKIDSNTILFLGLGEDRRNVVKFDIQNKELSLYKRLPSALAGSSILLNDNKILFYHGIIKDPDYIKSTFLVHAIYDYKKNKIYDKKTIRGTDYKANLIKLKDYIYIDSDKDFLFKYTN